MRRYILAAAVCATALALGSCASLQRSFDEGDMRKIVDLINHGQGEALAGMSATPFLVDGEVVVLPADVAGFWAGIVKSGYRVQGAALASGTKVAADSYTLFASTMEVKSYFSRYVKDGGRVLELTTDGGKRVRILLRSAWPSWKIAGWKGPF
ncbi:MAG TPA: hypothetical protein VHE79_01960 [Spirochaetia bacterium]